MATTDTSVWMRPRADGDALTWGRRDGIVFGIPSAGGMPGPRGLIRVGICDTTGTTELINFIAIEPVVKGAGDRFGRIGFSELEPSKVDPGEDGKRLWVEEKSGELTTGLVERLTVRMEVEPFTSNGAHVYVIASVSADRPHELELAVHHHDDSAQIEELTLSATMGNYERLRHLWLKDRVEDSREVYDGFKGNDFIEKESYPLEQMLRNRAGDAIVFATTNEEDPTSSPLPARSWWNYKSVKLTQYWRVAKEHIQPDLRVRVNGRRLYYLSKRAIPGGISFENFEVRQRYVPGQVFVFGLTEKEPRQFDAHIDGLPAQPD